MPVALNLKNRKFGRLRVLFRVSNGKQKQVRWRCKCKCGKSTIVATNHLRSGHTTSCGCWQGKRHGYCYTPEYRIYCAAKQRCNYKKSRHWKNYGGRGIKFCFKSFMEFYEEIGPRPNSRYSIDRIDNDGHYKKGNVRWAGRGTQARNKRRKGGR